MNAERLFHQFIPKHFSRPKIKLYQIITYQILGLLIFRYRWEMTTYTIGKISCPPGFGYPNLGRDIPFFKHLFLHFIKAIIEWRCFGIFPPQYIWVYLPDCRRNIRSTLLLRAKSILYPRLPL